MSVAAEPGWVAGNPIALLGSIVFFAVAWGISPRALLAFLKLERGAEVGPLFGRLASVEQLTAAPRLAGTVERGAASERADRLVRVGDRIKEESVFALACGPSMLRGRGALLLRSACGSTS